MNKKTKNITYIKNEDEEDIKINCSNDCVFQKKKVNNKHYKNEINDYTN